MSVNNLKYEIDEAEFIRISVENLLGSENLNLLKYFGGDTAELARFLGSYQSTFPLLRELKTYVKNYALDTNAEFDFREMDSYLIPIFSGVDYAAYASNKRMKPHEVNWMSLFCHTPYLLFYFYTATLQVGKIKHMRRLLIRNSFKLDVYEMADLTDKIDLYLENLTF